MRSRLFTAYVLGLLTLPAFGLADPPLTTAGERLDPADYGPGYIESMDDVVARQIAARAAIEDNDDLLNTREGRWQIPSPGATFYPSSGRHNLVNEWGSTSMGISFPTSVDFDGAFVAGQGEPQLWTPCLRAIGYRGGAEVAISDWFTAIDAAPVWFQIGFENVDRVVFEAAPAVSSAGWYALDDLSYTVRPQREGDAALPVVLDFEDTNYKQVLTGSNYAGLTWEKGAVGFRGADIVPAPKSPPADAGDESGKVGPGGAGGGTRGGGGTAPILEGHFQGVIRGDAGSFSGPPDTIGAAGPDHYVITVNRNFAVYDKDTGANLINVTLGSFLPGSNGDPRVLYDQHSGRWIVLVTDFSGGQRIYLAVSLTSDATGSWFKVNFRTDEGSDAGCWPDYPTLGVDAQGIYTSAYMVGCGMSIFVIDKAPLIAAAPSLGAVTAFRGFGFEGAIQPLHVYGPTPAQYYISTFASSGLMVRRINYPASAPTLDHLGVVAVPTYAEPPNAPALGSTPALNTVGSRLMNAIYRDGDIWTAHTVNVDGRAGCRWYQIDVDTLTLTQHGTVSDPQRYYYFPGLATNAAGDMVIGFSGSKADEYAGAYYAGRVASDPPGETSPAAQYRPGVAPQNLVDGAGRNRWGDYSVTTIDPDDFTFWTIQEYAHATDIWGTAFARLTHTQPALRIELPTGTPTLLSPGVASSFDVNVVPVEQNVVPGSPTLHYRLAGGAYQTAPLQSVGGNAYLATIPAPDCGDLAEFYLSAEGDGGAVVTSPSSAPASVYSAAVGQNDAGFADNFETDTGWTTEVLGATSGQWQRGIPVNDPAWDYDPTSDADGSGQCYLTQNALGNTDVDNGSVRLTSPDIDMSGGAVTLRYAYYLTLTNGDGSDRLLVEINTNGGAGAWTTIATHTTDGGLVWRTNSISPADLANAGVTPSANTRLRFTANDGGTQSIVEAGVDALSISLFTCVPPGDCIGDFDGDGDRDLADLATLLGNYGTASGATFEDGDTDGDGDIDLTDLAATLAVYGLPC